MQHERNAADTLRANCLQHPPLQKSKLSLTGQGKQTGSILCFSDILVMHWLTWRFRSQRFSFLCFSIANLPCWYGRPVRQNIFNV